MISKFDSVDSIVNYLREPTVSSTIPSSNDLKSSKKQQNDKDLTNVISTTPPPQLERDVQILSKGRVR